MTNPVPKGNLVTPVAFNPSDALGVFNVDSSGNLKVTIAGETVTVSATVLPHDVYNQSGVTQKLADNTANNATVTVYTVTTGKTLYLNSLHITLVTTNAGITVGTLVIANASAVAQITYGLYAVLNSLSIVSIPFPVPMQLGSAWTIKITSPDLTTSIKAAIHGYEL